MEERKGQLRNAGQVPGLAGRQYYRKQSQRKANEQNYPGEGASWARGEPD